MGKQHELLAVEKNINIEAERRHSECINTFEKKSTTFNGLIKETQSVEEDAERIPSEIVKIISTVKEKLEYAFEGLIDQVDVIISKDSTNCNAKADINIDGEIIATGVPATTLLALEKKLHGWKRMLATIPTLDPGTAWEADSAHAGQFVFKEAEKDITIKDIAPLVLYPATDKHPAQVKMIEKKVKIGTACTTKFSSMYTVGKKADLLAKLDNLHKGVKAARSRANEEEVVDVKIGKKLADYIFG